MAQCAMGVVRVAETRLLSLTTTIPFRSTSPGQLSSRNFRSVQWIEFSSHASVVFWVRARRLRSLVPRENWLLVA